MIEYLREQLKNKDKELFIVVSKQTGESRLWLNNNKHPIDNENNITSSNSVDNDNHDNNDIDTSQVDNR